MLKRDSIEVMSKLKQIVMLDVNLVFIILSCQRPDTKSLGNSIRNWFRKNIQSRLHNNVINTPFKSQVKVVDM